MPVSHGQASSLYLNLKFKFKFKFSDCDSESVSESDLPPRAGPYSLQGRTGKATEVEVGLTNA